MTTIDEEIQQFFREYRIKELIMPYNVLPNHLQKLQHYILAAHSHLNGDMLVRILSEIRYQAGGGITNTTWDKINLTIQDSLNELTYISKVSVIEAYADVSAELTSALIKVNKYRNEFAHKRPELLIDKYKLETPKGKLNARDLIRALKKAENLFFEHTESSEACNYYVRMQIEKSKESMK